MAGTPVELHVVSDSTGETAARLVTALEAQFPDQPFVEVRHPRVESVQDLARAVSRAKGRPAVIVYTLVKPEWRQAMRSSGARTKRAVVEEALRLLIRTHSQASMRRLRGKVSWEGELESSRLGRLTKRRR